MRDGRTRRWGRARPVAGRGIASAAVAAVMLVTAGCADQPDAPDGAVVPTPRPASETTLVAAGDRVVTTATVPTGDLSVDLAAAPRAVGLGDVPRWLVGAPLADGSVALLAVTEADEVRTLRIAPDRVEEVGRPEQRSWHPPPTLGTVDGTLTLVPHPADAGEHSPVTLLPGGRAVYASSDGMLVVDAPDGPRRHALDLLPDTWVVPVGDGRVAALAAPTDVYGHGVLGDAIEAQQVVVVDPSTGEVSARITVDGVVEGVRPWIGRLPGLETPVVVVTVSDAEGGADVVAYTLGGTQVASTGAIGTGNRWRHVIAVDGAFGLVEVVTPHLGKELRVAIPDGARLVTTSSSPGAMSSHAIGSRDLDQAKLVRLDGRPVVIGPGPDRGELVAIAVDDGEVLARQPLPAPWASSLAVVDSRHGGVVAVGLEDGTVLLWGLTR